MNRKELLLRNKLMFFLEFCKLNLDSISNNNFNFINFEIKFSDKAYINLQDIINITQENDKEETILTILSYLNLFSFY